MNPKYSEFLNKVKDALAGGQKVSLVPHDVADVDALLSCFLFAHVLSVMGIDHEIIVFDTEFSKETVEILEFLGIDIGQIFEPDEEDQNRKLILLDHYETRHEGKVIGILDHHPAKGVKCNNYIYEKTSSCAMIILRIMHELWINLTPDIIEMVMYATAVDTVAFTSDKARKDEAGLLQYLCKQYLLNFDLICEKSKLPQDLNQMTIEEIATNGQKRYNYSKPVASSYVQSNERLSQDQLKAVVSHIQKLMAEENLYLWVFIEYDLKAERTEVYYIYKNSSDDALLYNGYLSRGTTIMPNVHINLIRHGYKEE